MLNLRGLLSCCEEHGHLLGHLEPSRNLGLRAEGWTYMAVIF